MSYVLDCCDCKEQYHAFPADKDDIHRCDPCWQAYAKRMDADNTKLLTYAQHWPACEDEMDHNKPCTCGLDKLLDAKEDK